MAQIFGVDDDIVTVIGPDGQPRQLPRSIANQFPALQIAGAGVDTVFPDVTGGAPLPPPPKPEPAGKNTPPKPPLQIPRNFDPKQPPFFPGVPSGGRRDPLAVGTGEEQVAAPRAPTVTADLPEWMRPLPEDVEAQERAEQQRQAAEPTPTPEQPTDLRTVGAGGVYDEKAAALEDQRRAGMARAEIEAEAQDEGRRVYEARQVELENERYTQRRIEEEMAADVKRRQVSADKAITNLANHKVDRGRKWRSMSTGSKVASFLMSLISGIGSALKKQGDKNPALDILNAAIEADVQDQYAQQDKLERMVGHKRNAWTDARQVFADRQAMNKAVLASTKERYADELEAIAARSASDKTRAAALEYAGKLRYMRAEDMDAAWKAQAAADQAQEELAQRERERKTQAGIAWSRIKLDREEFAYRKEKDEKDREAALAAARNETEAQLFGNANKALTERGVYDANGEIMLQPEGVAVVEQANQIETAAATEQDPARRDAMLRQAAEMRGAAKLRYGLTARDTDEAKKIAGTLSGFQTLGAFFDEIERVRGSGLDFKNPLKVKKYLDSKEGLTLQSLTKQAAVAYRNLEQLGALDKGMVELGEQILGNPLELMSNAPAIQTARRGVLISTNAKLKQIGYRGEVDYTSFANPAAAARTEADESYKRIEAAQTPDEIAAAEEPWRITKGLNRALWPTSKAPSEERPEQARQAAMSPTIPGVTREQGDEIVEMARRAAGGSKQDRKLLLGLVERNDGRSAGAIAALGEVGATDDLRQIISAHPASSNTAKRAARALETAEHVHIERLAPAARAGDEAARTELLRIMNSSGGEARRHAISVLTGAEYKIRPSSPIGEP